MRKIIILLLACAAMLAAGCAFHGAGAGAEEPGTYTVRFWNGDQLLQAQSVEKDAFPTALSLPDSEGAHFIGWDRDYAPAASDQDHHAVFAPVLSRHVPYLFPDEAGRLEPEAPFTGRMLTAALTALTTDDARALFPELPADDEEITGAALHTVFEGFFFENGLPDFGPDGGEVLTRAQAAAYMNALLGRAGEAVSPSQRAGFADVPPEREYYADMMEAAAGHVPGDAAWEDIVLPTGLAPGWLLEAGRLRYVDERGYFKGDFVTETGAAVDAQGYYTSGSEELDGYVTEIIAAFQARDPEADELALLRDCYDYVRDGFTYLRKNAYAMGATGWEVDDALVMFSTERGNCYNYAAAFWALARGLGFDAKAVSGTISKTDQPHGWVEIDIDGVTYYFDAETEMAYIVKGEQSRDMFMMTWGFASTWSYKK